MSSESFDIYYNSLHFLLNEVHCLKKQHFLVEKSGLMIKKNDHASKLFMF
jgi:hypothetical protein